MIGNGYWSTGITVRFSDGKWAASAGYLDNGFCDDSAEQERVSTQGKLHTRYYLRDGQTKDALTVAVDTVKTDAERLGISWRDPHVYMDGDGEWEDREYPPDWRLLVDEQARRLGWDPLYRGLDLEASAQNVPDDHE